MSEDGMAFLMVTAILCIGVLAFIGCASVTPLPQPLVSQQQQPDPGGTATSVWLQLGTRTAELAKCRQHHEAALISAFAWYTTTLAMQTACPDSGVATPNVPSP